MIGLAGLLSSAWGRALLEEHEVHASPDTFMAALEPPRGKAGESLPPIFVHQQPCPDFAPSVMAKFELLDHLYRTFGHEAASCFVAIDTDRAASSKVATRISWRAGEATRFVTLTPPGTKRMEFRHIHIAPEMLASAAHRVEAWARQSAGPGWEDRLREIMPLLSPSRSQTYGDYALGLCAFLLERTMGTAPAIRTVSSLQDHPAVRGALVDLLTARLDFISAFNARIAAFRARGIETAVSPLAGEELPLFYSCPADGERVRVRLVERRGEAIAETRAGRSYRFPAEPAALAAALLDSGRASLDVMLPVLLTPLFSGLVAGRSSALYCMVMRSAMMEALGTRLMPLLVPERLAEKPADGRGLFQRWLEGGGS